MASAATTAAGSGRRPFTTLLVANRGEVAVRVLHAARAAGLRTVAVYSDADAASPHVRLADTAVRLGPAPAAQSYLDIPALIEAVRRTGADAVHPGYGFLSESAAFARACEDAGLTFVGPPSDVIALMGRKDAARSVAVRAGVPVLPAVVDGDRPGTGDGDQQLAYDDPTRDGDLAQADRAHDDDLARRALAEVGLPLLVKAAAGGGGKGMRVVRDAADLPAAIAAARREATAAFGDGALLVERYVEGGRHVEVQVLADTRGTVLHLFERDCSVQRRHQKVVEEAPAPTITAAVREELTAAAVRLAREVGYVGAGTVEFLVAGDEAYLLEMNTRLQVEHPVTEAVTGLDLVALQLAVARGDRLPLRQEDVAVTGHAIEVRVYAEGPDFLPQAGTATTVRWPTTARTDTALEAGQEVGTWYDPLLAKIIADAPTRESARAALVRALDNTAVLGVTTNTGFLRRLVASDDFRDAAIDTAWLDTHPGAFAAEPDDVALVAGAVALADSLTGAGFGPGATNGNGAANPFGAGDGWRLGGPPAPVVLTLEHDGQVHEVRVGTHDLVVDGRTFTVRRLPGVPAPYAPDVPAVSGLGAGHELRLEIDGLAHAVVVETGPGRVAVARHGQTTVLTVPDRRGRGAESSSDGAVAAPMPGLVRDVAVEAGEHVEAGAVLGVLEAMKMETRLLAPHPGTVAEVLVAPGDQVTLGQALFTVRGHG
ncbi:biotin carboxylase N-terminal domain-containing protein [Georgenia sp. M64]|uniref:ATP-binding protein n=1 Tax=Georgenia sp. M64 TaxID=3120520 RepID=UPI0030E373AD